jgi:integrase
MNNLTDTKCKTAKPLPEGKTNRLNDGKGLFLFVETTKTGNAAKRWRHKFTFAGKAQSLSLGSYPEIGLSQARDKHQEHRRLIANGINPASLRKETKELKVLESKGSFQAVVLEFLQVKKKTLATETYNTLVKRLKADLLPWLGDKNIKDITPKELLACIKRIEQRAANTARRALGECGQIWRYAVLNEYASQDITQILRGQITAPKVKHFAAIVEPKEAKMLIANIQQYRGSFTVKSALLISALLFQRQGEIRTMKWADLDLEAGEWRYVISKTKTDHLVPLATQAIAILKELQPLTGRFEYVFPNGKSPKRALSENGVRAALRTMGYTNEQMSAHGFRAMARSLLAEQGFPIDAIERQLGHKPNGRINQAYDRAQHLKERKIIMQAWADFLLGSEIT